MKNMVRLFVYKYSVFIILLCQISLPNSIYASEFINLGDSVSWEALNDQFGEPAPLKEETQIVFFANSLEGIELLDQFMEEVNEDELESMKWQVVLNVYTYRGKIHSLSDYIEEKEKELGLFFLKSKPYPVAIDYIGKETSFFSSLITEKGLSVILIYNGAFGGVGGGQTVDELKEGIERIKSSRKWLEKNGF
ncbi:hypothetical protein [Amphritea japonica]|uniref:Uncharacterized protein n=1 Tax=Amphritea japonica ATCC BAA-1530 TaxID=1278309 RepID=A0A7R6PKP4_9GAMM|nr:hypothetical protein [Amphritea japonica]BBB25273.1 hypothetical protein AMJAP_0674 [Amphritea japonica ATCC BAA-1530]